MNNLHMEFVGGLGDAILRIYFSGQAWYGALERLKPEQRATVALMCHNPHLKEIVEWHPKKSQITVMDLGFTTPFHPWENKEWRKNNGLPEEPPCPPNAPSKTLKFYPGPNDEELLGHLKNEQFIVMGATASTDERTIPSGIRHDAAKLAIKGGYRILVVGRSKYFHGQRQGDLECLNNKSIINAVDLLSVPGTIEAVKMAAGVIAAHSAVLHMAWSERRPVFLLYNEWMKQTLLPHGPVGYMQGIKRENTDHMEFSEYTTDRFSQWMIRL